jgi:hypothetical protein
MTDFLISEYLTTNFNDYDYLLVNINANHNYLLNYDNANHDLFEQFVYKTITFHLKDKNIEFDKNKHVIEFSFMNSISNYTIEYNKKCKIHPILSTITYLNSTIYAPNTTKVSK